MRLQRSNYPRNLKRGLGTSMLSPRRQTVICNLRPPSHSLIHARDEIGLHFVAVTIPIHTVTGCRFIEKDNDEKKTKGRKENDDVSIASLLFFFFRVGLIKSHRHVVFTFSDADLCLLTLHEWDT